DRDAKTEQAITDFLNNHLGTELSQPSSSVVVTTSDSGVHYGMTLNFDLADVSLPVSFKAGLAGLGLDVDTTVNVGLSFALKLGFGANKADGFYLDTGDPQGITVTAHTSAPTIGAAVNLGFLKITASGIAGLPALDVKGSFTGGLTDPGHDGRLTADKLGG